ncbi:response regulator [Stieleria sp. TO1_6]|uniref:response regulator n=1 Tax=Stieleria tagensis TaxID=2956795 RepID=UPI00209AD0E8|nr:response regulator [Stieleria tagensis]MCO8124899.1 response regulator [Stieleria tagensis]
MAEPVSREMHRDDFEAFDQDAQVALIRLDRQFRIRCFTTAATEIYGLIEADIGRPLAQLMPLLPDMPPLPDMQFLEVDQADECLIRSDSGKTFLRRVIASFDSAGQTDGMVLLFLDVTRLQVGQDERAETLQQLTRHAQRLRGITDATPSMIAYVNSELRYEFVNQRYADRFQRPPEALLCKTVEEVLGPQNFSQVKPHLHAALRGEKRVFELELQLPGNGKWVFKEVTYVPDVGPSGSVDGCYVFAIDVTERRRSAIEIADREQRLAAVTQRMALAIESAGMGSFEWDPETDAVAWDEQHLAISGLPDSPHPLGKMFLDLVHPDDAQRNRQAIEYAIATRGEYTGEFRIIRPDGEVRWLAARAKMVPGQQGRGDRMVGLNWDISQQKNSLEQVRLAEERLRLAAEAAGFGTYQIDLISGRTYWSDEFKKIVGAAADADQKLRADAVADFVHPEDRNRVARLMSRAKRSLDGGVHSFSHRIVLADGRIRWVRRKGQTIRSDSTGKPIQIIGTLLDISAQKEIEQSLEEARRVAEAANKSKSEFLANMSHEIRTPMSAIMGYTDILSRQLTDPDDIKCASVIRHNGKFLLEIINDILDISKIEAGKLGLIKKRFRPDLLVADVYSLMEVRAAEKSIPLEVRFEGLIPKTIRSDDKRLKQILVNLLGNAIKFTKDGSVQLSIRYLPNPQSVSDDSSSKGVSRLQFNVIDTGIGINERQMKGLFQPFTQGDMSVVRQFEGTGLGLSISQRLARMLGGDIAVESVSDVGSKFTLTIETGSLKNVPLIEPTLIESRTIKPVNPTRGNLVGRRILVVDDRRDMRFLAQHMIEDAGGQAASAENGQQAIAEIEDARRAGRPFDLIAMDMQMPVLDGYEATRRLRCSGYDKPIIAVTAHAMHGDRQRCMDAGCTDYITKPLDGPKFIALIEEKLQSSTPSASTDEVTDQPMLDVAKPCKVLVIDDAEDACQSLKTLLGYSGHQVDLAHDGRSGIAKATSGVPDVVLLDLGLPDMSGFDVFRRLKAEQELRDTYFIAATGADNFAETKAAGFDHHLMKPFDVDELEILIDSKSKPLPR